MEAWAWAEHFAREVIPEEAELAAPMAMAYAAGGTARKELFDRRAEGTLGGFGAGGVALVMPWLLQAIHRGSTLLLALLSSKLVGDLVACVRNVLELIQSGRSQAATGAIPPASSLYVPLRQVIDVMGNELRASGIEGNQADVITLRAIKSMLENPREAEQLVRGLSRQAG
jgi:hypothetical protein